MSKITLSLPLFAVGVLCMAWGQDKPPAGKKASTPPGMSMPKPAPEMKELHDLVGTWTTEETFEPSPMMPSGGTATGINTVRLGPGGFTVLMEQRSKSAMGSFSGHGVLTWDPNQKAYKTFWADSMMPGVMVETGHKEGETIVFTGDTIMMGKKTSIREVISDRTPTSYTLTESANDGSGEKKAMTIKFTKQPPPPSAKK